MRRVAWGLAALVALLAALLAAAVVTATTPGGFRWLTGVASALSGERLSFEGVEGHLGAPIGIRRLTLATAGQRVEIEGLRLEWRPRALWQRRIEVDLLAAQAMRLSLLEKEAQPTELPASLRLPFDLRVRVFDLARLDIVRAGRTVSLRDLKASLDGTGDRYRLAGASLSSPWGDASGQFEIGKDAPFALQGRVDTVHPDPVPVGARLDLSGTLAALTFRLDAAGAGMSAFASGEAAPFAKIRLPRLLVAGEGVDPRLFAADAPAADFAFSGIFEGLEGERLLGTFSLSNRLAGRLDQHRLPLANLTGAVLGDVTSADLSDLAVDLGAAGQVIGDGQWRDGRITLNLASRNLNLAGLHGDLYATRMRAAFQLAGDATRQTLAAEVAETWGQGRFVLSHADAALRLESADFSGQAGRLTAQGVLQLDPGRAFSAEFDATRINPARFGEFPQGRLNARGQVSGALAPELRLQARFTLPPGTLEGRPVKGQGRFDYESRRLADADVDVNLAGNRARVQGAYGRAGDRLVWDIDAPALDRLNLGLAGRLTSRGSVSGDPDRLRVEGALAASGLRLRDAFVADTLNLELDLEAAADGAFDGKLEARGVTLAGQRLSLVRATAEGRRNAHTLALDARLPEWRVTAGLAGGLDEEQVWRGQLNRAEAQGPWPMALAAPAGLVLSRAQQQVSNLVLSVAEGRVVVEHFSRRGTQLASRGILVDLPVAPLLALLEEAPPFTTDLRVNGEWDLKAGETLDGQLRLSRQSGDVRLDDPALSLGLTTLALALDAEASRVTVRVDAASREAGQLRAGGQATLAREGAAFTLPRTAPLAWDAQLDAPDLRLLRPLFPVGVRADARVDARLTGSGSLAAPRIDGRIAADAIRFSMPDEGVSITDGTLRLVLADDRVRVEEGELKGQSGRVVVSGEAQLRDPQAGLTLNFEKFAATNRSDRRVIVSGVSQLALSQKRLRLEGELRADRARLETPEASRPELSSDVVVVGQPPREEAAARRIPLELDLKLDLGDDFLFKGSGLDARLGGQLRVFTVEEALRGEGRIRVVEGRYAAYGQTLDIERGELGFVGPIGNPGIDVLATRTFPTVKTGVQVRGTVQHPVVTLYSDPAMPDTEKLSWLVLGHGLEKGTQQEFALLQLAAGALFAQAESVSVQAQLAEALRIDTFAVRGGEGEDLATTVVSVGKRISSRATLSYEQSLDGLNQVVKVLYQLTPHVRLEAQAGQQQSSFDAIYTREYD